MTAPPDRARRAPEQPELPQEAYAAGLASLPGIGPARLASLLAEAPPRTVWRRVLAAEVQRLDRPPATGAGSGGGATGEKRVSWADAAARMNIGSAWRHIVGGGITVAYLGGMGFPPPLAEDPEPPGVVFWRGDLPGLLRAPRVAIVGTRHCTSYGRTVASRLGCDLAACGVCVVSGLALGIDGAAHEGVLRAVGGVGPLGVAASGVDYPYPVRHTDLWGQVAAAGAILSETAPGRPAQAWRFPARNRLIAALAQAVVVVESHAGGGSMLTVAAAAERGVDVLAVPGPVTSASSIGTNQLLHEGLAPVRHAGDVLAALGDFRPWPTTSTPERERVRQLSFGSAPASGRAAAQGDPDPLARRVLDAIDRTPTATSLVAERAGLALGALGLVLVRLQEVGLIRGQGMWWERCDRQ